MPRIRALKTYSNEFWDIIQGCAERHERYSLEVDTITEALTMQGKFYSFRGALRREVDAAIKNPDAAYDRDRNKIALAQAENTLCWIDRKEVPVKVSFVHKDESPTSITLRKMIANRRETELPEDVQRQLQESAARRLKEQEELNSGPPPVDKNYG